jgi:uncharacterized protein YifE (UPF0438 family)
MPTRYLKAGIRDSELIDKLSPMAETFFYRLLVTVDDFGRYDARASMIKAHCYPIKESVTAKKCAELLKELSDAGMIEIYMVDEKEYLQVCRWDNIPRAKESKFPQKPANVNHLHTDVYITHTDVPLTVTVTETKTETETEDGFALFWSTYPNTQRKQSKGKCEDVWKKGKLRIDKQKIVDHIESLKTSVDWLKDNGQFIPAPLVYLNQRRWEGVEPLRTVSNLMAGAI